MPYEIKVIPKVGIATIKTERDKVAASDYIKKSFSYGLWGDNVKIEITKK